MDFPSVEILSFFLERILVVDKKELGCRLDEILVKLFLGELRSKTMWSTRPYTSPYRILEKHSKGYCEQSQTHGGASATPKLLKGSCWARYLDYMSIFLPRFPTTRQSIGNNVFVRSKSHMDSGSIWRHMELARD